MTEWEILQKPAELAEARLIEAILDETFAINTNLPAERELAEKIGVTRPTLREALQRLSRDGWIEIRHGKSTRVRDYWREGNLLILSSICKHQKKLPLNFVSNLLQVRLLLSPAYTRLAIQNAPNEVIRILQAYQSIPDSSEEFSRLDFNLHYKLTILSGNPIFTLILNGFSDLYLSMGLKYFSQSQARDHSRSFYKKLLSAVLSNDAFLAEEVTRRVMEDSIRLWSGVTGNDEEQN